MRDEMESTERQVPAARRPAELANPRLPRSERSRQGARAAASGDTDKAQSDPTHHHPGAPIGRHVVAVGTDSRWRRHRPAESSGLHRRQDREGTIRQSYPADPDRPGRGVAGRLRRWYVPYPLHQALRRSRCRRIALYRQQVAERSGSLHQLYSNERSARRRCRCAHRHPTDRLIAVSETVEERINGNGRPTRLDEAAKAVHVTQRCGTDRRPACHVPLPARLGYHIDITVNYSLDRRQIAKPQVASVAVLVNPVSVCGIPGARTMLGVSYEVDWGISRDAGNTLALFDLPVSAG